MACSEISSLGPLAAQKARPVEQGVGGQGVWETGTPETRGLLLASVTPNFWPWEPAKQGDRETEKQEIRETGNQGAREPGGYVWACRSSGNQGTRWQCVGLSVIPNFLP